MIDHCSQPRVARSSGLVLSLLRSSRILYCQPSLGDVFPATAIAVLSARLIGNICSRPRRRVQRMARLTRMRDTTCMYAIYSLAKRIHAAEMQPAVRNNVSTRERNACRETRCKSNQPCMMRASGSRKNKTRSDAPNGSITIERQNQTKRSCLQGSDHFLLYCTDSFRKSQKKSDRQQTCEGRTVTIPCFLQRFMQHAKGLEHSQTIIARVLRKPIKHVNHETTNFDRSARDNKTTSRAGKRTKKETKADLSEFLGVHVFEMQKQT
jgi:hypothetical protein